MNVDILACPACKSALQLMHGEWVCDSCGTVALQRQGIADFLYDTPEIRLANEGSWNLAQDQHIGLRLLELFDQHTYVELSEHARLLRTDADGFVSDPHARLLTGRLALRAQRRFARRYERVADEVGRGHGEQMLHKIETRLRDLGQSPMPAHLAIELGGGDGQYLLGFANRFEHVLFVDGSLVNVVLARAMARDDGVTNVSFLRSDITVLPVTSSVASMVHANGVIEHVSDPVALVTEGVRVTRRDGCSVVVSPNRIPVTIEPHFRLPLFGLIPKAVRVRLIAVSRGKESEAGTQLLTIWRLRRTLQRANAAWDVFVIPRGIGSTARRTPMRTILAKAMRSPFGAVADRLVNQILLPVAHCHIAIGRPGE